MISIHSADPTSTDSTNCDKVTPSIHISLYMNCIMTHSFVTMQDHNIEKYNKCATFGSIVAIFIVFSLVYELQHISLHPLQCVGMFHCVGPCYLTYSAVASQTSSQIISERAVCHDPTHWHAK